jgi:hypothetical protein
MRQSQPRRVVSMPGQGGKTLPARLEAGVES